MIMGVMDKFLNIMRLNDDDDEDYYEDDYIDEEEEEEEKPPRRKLMQKSRDRDSEDDMEEDRPTKQPPAKVTPMRSPGSSRRSSSFAGMEVCVIKPTSVEDSREIADTLMAERTVVLNLEGLEVEIAQRIVDFTSGSCYALKGNLQKISQYIFIVTPKSVDVSGDFQDMLSNGYEGSLDTSL